MFTKRFVTLMLAATFFAACSSDTAKKVAKAATDTTDETQIGDETNAIAVTISPTSVTVKVGQTATFEAAVAGTSETSVTWSVEENNGGSIDANGKYTAPNVKGTYHVVATSDADDTKSAKATVTVVEDTGSGGGGSNALSISPLSATVELLGQVDFDLTGLANDKDAEWTATLGAVNPQGKYTAPITPGTYTVTATDKSDSTRKVSAKVTVKNPTIVVSVWTNYPSVETGGSKMFYAAVSSTTNFGGYTWSVQEGVAGGYITQNGLYTAPVTPGTYHVVATSEYDTSKKGVIAVTVHPIKPIITITPKFPRVETTGTLTFAVAVTDTRFTGWYGKIVESDGNQNGGSLAGDMLTYTAPVTTGNYTYRVTSAYDPSIAEEVTIEVHTPEPYANLSPASITMYTDDTQGFSGSITNTSFNGYTFELLGSDSGTITSGGVYTSPVTEGTYTIVLRSTYDPTVTATATVKARRLICPVNAQMAVYFTDGGENESLDPYSSANDDIATSYTRYEVSGNTAQRALTLFDGLGSDDLLISADGVVTATTFINLGADGVFATEDDVASQVYRAFYDESTNLQTGYAYMVSGPDGKLGTGDDIVMSGAEIVYDGSNRPAIIKRYVNLGIDGDNVANGEIYEVVKLDYRGYGSYVVYMNAWINGYWYHVEKFTSPGADGQWNLEIDNFSNGDNDDVSEGYERWVYDTASLDRPEARAVYRENNTLETGYRAWWSYSSGYYINYARHYNGKGNGSIDQVGYNDYFWEQSAWSQNSSVRLPGRFTQEDRNGQRVKYTEVFECE